MDINCKFIHCPLQAQEQRASDLNVIALIYSPAPPEFNRLHNYTPATLRGDKVSMLTHTYPHKPLRKIKMTICNDHADNPLYVWPDV